MTVEFTKNSEILPNSNSNNNNLHKESLHNHDDDDHHVFIPFPTTSAPIPSLHANNNATNNGDAVNVPGIKENTTAESAGTATADDERNPLYLEENLLPISVIAKIAKFAMIPGSASNTAAAAANDDAVGGGGKESEVMPAAAATIALSKEAKEVLARSCTGMLC